eukprot:57590-Pleurochrysis_carterae.AAC.1
MFYTAFLRFATRDCASVSNANRVLTPPIVPIPDGSSNRQSSTARAYQDQAVQIEEAWPATGTTEQNSAAAAAAEQSDMLAAQRHQLELIMVQALRLVEVKGYAVHHEVGLQSA